MLRAWTGPTQGMHRGCTKHVSTAHSVRYACTLHTSCCNPHLCANLQIPTLHLAPTACANLLMPTLLPYQQLIRNQMSYETSETWAPVLHVPIQQPGSRCICLVLVCHLQLLPGPRTCIPTCLHLNGAF